jgi:hypothetical protein
MARPDVRLSSPLVARTDSTVVFSQGRIVSEGALGDLASRAKRIYDRVFGDATLLAKRLAGEGMTVPPEVRTRSESQRLLYADDSIARSALRDRRGRSVI